MYHHTKAQKQFHIFSHHESVESLYYFLKKVFDIKNANNSLYVNFTSFINIELYRKNNENNEYHENDFYIKLIYDNQQLGNDIPYQEFYDKINPKIISFQQLKDYCGITEEKKDVVIITLNVGLKIFGIILMCIFSLLLVVAIVLFCKISKNNFIDLPEEILSNSES